MPVHEITPVFDASAHRVYSDIIRVNAGCFYNSKVVRKDSEIA